MRHARFNPRTLPSSMFTLPTAVCFVIPHLGYVQCATLIVHCKKYILH